MDHENNSLRNRQKKLEDNLMKDILTAEQLNEVIAREQIACTNSDVRPEGIDPEWIEEDGTVHVPKGRYECVWPEHATSHRFNGDCTVSHLD